MEKLFSYGTLQLESVQLQTFGRLLEGKKDRLFGYKTEFVEITDEEVLRKSGEKYHPILRKSVNANDFTVGVVYEITEEELQQADLYEVDDYKRVLEKFESGVEAWIYIEK